MTFLGSHVTSLPQLLLVRKKDLPRNPFLRPQKQQEHPQQKHGLDPRPSARLVRAIHPIPVVPGGSRFGTTGPVEHTGTITIESFGTHHHRKEGGSQFHVDGIGSCGSRDFACQMAGVDLTRADYSGKSLGLIPRTIRIRRMDRQNGIQERCQTAQRGELSWQSGFSGDTGSLIRVGDNGLLHQEEAPARPFRLGVARCYIV